MPKIIFVSGGVISGLGKGIVAASVAKLMQARGFSTTAIKIDPYINFDAGTLRPTEHGEVWVTHDGGEIDQDLGNYERFLRIDLPKKNNITTGQIYKAVIDKERAGAYLGQTVQFVPHIIDEIKLRLSDAAGDNEIAVVELGGTVGDYENAPYLHAIRQLDQELGPHSVAYIMVSYLPIPSHINEMKTRPTQQAFRTLGQEGILPHFIVCRAHYDLDDIRKHKIQQGTGLPLDRIISAPNVETIYQFPLVLESQNVAANLLKILALSPKKAPDWDNWKTSVSFLTSKRDALHIGIVGKYLESGDYVVKDSYVSVEQAIFHAAAALGTSVTLEWVSSADIERDPLNTATVLGKLDAVVVPGGFGTTGTDGKIATIRYLREYNIPFLGICYGFQLAVVEYARTILGLSDAHTTEICKDTSSPVICLLSEQEGILEKNEVGGTMRLGSFPAQLVHGSKVHALYRAAQRCSADEFSTVHERHRHRYEVNPGFIPALAKRGLCFSGSYAQTDGSRLMEFLELPDHCFFVATQAHPEFTSRFGDPNPLFYGLIKAAREKAGNF